MNKETHQSLLIGGSRIENLNSQVTSRSTEIPTDGPRSRSTLAHLVASRHPIRIRPVKYFAFETPDDIYRFIRSTGCFSRGRRFIATAAPPAGAATKSKYE
ncbi:hypothetical protein EVAR_59051_1 [Eumeta japonica]|uniref:Uncharacterized protein n=1 Tax=Eumeta variegata TaxID=151549 RepID=A0A4C1YE81_EUMVA|nr:hypothetical protein EVAR_59051_1 [Eumeta japonica]